MIKIFLVEDEFVVREGIKKIDWNQYGYEFCGEASDGELALPLIAKLHPDIVITDIKMPFMDGLELSRHIRKDYPEIEIVILSGYEEFSYAKEAISLGVSRYLSKPISSENLLKELDELKSQIEAKRREKEVAERYLNDMEEEIEENYRQFFGELVSNGAKASELIEKGAELGIELNSLYYRIILCNMLVAGKDSFSSEYNALAAELDQWSKQKDFVIFDRDTEGKAVLVSADSTEEMERKIIEYTDEFKSRIGSHENISYYAGIGKTVGRLSELSVSFNTARAAYAHRFFDEGNKITYYEQLEKMSAGEQEQLDVDAIDSKAIDRAHFEDFFRSASVSDIEYFLDDFFGNLVAESIKSNMFRKYIVMNIYFSAVDFVQGLGGSKGDIESIDPALSVAANESSVRDYFRRLFTGVIELRESVSHSKHKKIVEESIRYIEDNYNNPDLSLNDLAEHMKFSPNHLSSIISRETGKSFSKYLIDIRIMKAKELLKCTSKKSSEISDEVGYTDPHYFSYMFKKVTGQTPTQYREGKQAAQEE